MTRQVGDKTVSNNVRMILEGTMPDQTIAICKNGVIVWVGSHDDLHDVVTHAPIPAVVVHKDGTASFLKDVDMIDGTVRAKRPDDKMREFGMIVDSTGKKIIGDITDELAKRDDE